MSANLPPAFCPYKGLQPYTEADRAFFFGRERDAAIIISNLSAAPLTIFYGESGVGKSSVLLAGAVPELRGTPRVAVGVFRNWQDAGFVAGLKAEVLRAVGESTGKQVNVDTDLPLDEFLSKAARALRGPIFLILDQFEEYFLYHPASEGADGFEAELARAINRREVDVNFLLSMREDGLSKLDRFQGRIPNLLNNMLRLEHLDRAGASDAIRKPLVEYNRQQTDAQAQMSIEDTLAQVLLDDLQSGKVTSEQAGQGQVASNNQAANGNGKIETPFLQMVLTRLWSEERGAGSHVLRLSTFEELGRTANIARTHLDNMMAKLSEAEQGIAARVLRYLVTPSGAKIAQEPGALIAWAELDEGPTQTILDRLSAPDMRILRKVSAPGQPVKYEIFHDVMAQAILDWRTRFEREEKRLEAERRLAAERAEAAEKLASAQRRARRLRWGTIGLSLLLLLTGALLLLVFRAKADARSRELAAYAISQLWVDPELSLLLAMKAAEARQTKKAESALRQALKHSHVQAVMRAKGAVRDAAISPDNKLVATASYGDVARVWDASTGELVKELAHADKAGMGVYSVAFSPDGKFLVTALWEGGRTLVWEVGSWKQVAELSGHTQTVYSVAFSPDGQFLITTGDDTSPRVWKVGTWEQTAVLQGVVVKPSPEPPAATGESKGAEPPALPAPSPSTAAQVPLAELRTEQTGHSRIVYNVTFSGDGKYAITSGKDRAVWIWEVGTWRPLGKLIGHDSAVKSASFSPNNEFVVTGGDDRSARVWKLTQDGSQLKGTQVAKMEHPGLVITVAFSPDGQFILTTCWDGIARLWTNWSTGAAVVGDKSEATEEVEESKRPKTPTKPQVATEFHGHTNWLFGAEFSRDGRFVVTSSQDRTARVWRTTDASEVTGSVDEMLSLAQKRVTRQLTPDEQTFYLGGQ